MFRELSIVDALPKLIVLRRSRLRWEQHVQSMVGVIQCTAEQAFLQLQEPIPSSYGLRKNWDLTTVNRVRDGVRVRILLALSCFTYCMFRKCAVSILPVASN